MIRGYRAVVDPACLASPMSATPSGCSATPTTWVRVATADLASQALRDEEPAGLDPSGLVAAGPTWRLS